MFLTNVQTRTSAKTGHQCNCDAKTENRTKTKQNQSFHVFYVCELYVCELFSKGSQQTIMQRVKRTAYNIRF